MRPLWREVLSGALIPYRECGSWCAFGYRAQARSGPRAAYGGTVLPAAADPVTS